MTVTMSKDAPLAESILHMQARLQAHGFDVEEYDWQNPVPHVWSVRMRDRLFPVLDVQGKGTSMQAAQASALGELFERLSSDNFFNGLFYGEEIAASDFVHHPSERWFALEKSGLPQGLLDEPTQSHYNLDGELSAKMLVDASSGNRSRGICALPFTRQQNQQTVWIPVNIIDNLYTTNGLAAGNSVYEARVQALSGIFERHIKTTILTAGISLPHIPASVVEGYREVADTLQLLRDEGFVVYVMDASLAGKFPLVCITLLDPNTGGCIAAFGAHPKFGIALQRAMVELLHKRSLDALRSLSPPTFNLREVAEPDNLQRHLRDSSGVVSWELFSSKSDYEYTAWNIEGDTQAEFERLCHLIHRVDMDIYIADYDHLGVYCCRVIVPGMADMFPVDRLVHDNNNKGIELRDFVMRMPMLSNHERQVFTQQLTRLDVDEQASLPEMCGILAEPANGLAGVTVAEVKALLYLTQGDISSAVESVSRVLETDGLPAKKAALYRCLHALGSALISTHVVADNYRKVLVDIYGDARVKRCEAMLAGRQLFDDFIEIKPDFSNSPQHAKTIGLYRRLQLAKQNSTS